MSARLIDAAVVWLLALVVPAAAQQSSAGRVSGSVVDPSDAVVIGVNLTLVPVGGGSGHSTATDANGRFVFAAVPAGTYVLRAEHVGFVPFERQVALNREGTVEEVVQLQVGATELITVAPEDRGYRPVLGTTATKLAGVPARDVPFAIEAIPARVLDEQRVQTVTQALRNVSGIGPTVGWGGANARYVMPWRGGHLSHEWLRLRHEWLVPLANRDVTIAAACSFGLSAPLELMRNRVIGRTK